MYCTVEDLQKQVSIEVLVMLTDDEATGELQQETAEKAIEDAGNEVDAWCRSRYPTPFQSVPGIINKITVDIALYNLFSRKGFDEESADKSIVYRYKNAVKLLENIAKGLVTLGQAAPPPAREYRIRSNRKLFSRQRMEGF